MFNVKIRNLITGSEYGFSMETMEQVQAQIESNRNSYGKDAWTETVPAWTDTSVDPPVEHPEEVINHLAECEITIVDSTEADLAKALQARIDKSWELSNSSCLAGADENARGRYLAWLIDPNCPQARKDKIYAVLAWLDSIWQARAVWKQNPTEDWVPPTTPCPYTFTQIAETV